MIRKLTPFSSSFSAPFDVAQAANWTCIENSELFVNPCPVLMSCYYSEELGDVNDVPTCHCGGIMRLGQDNFPVCDTYGSMSWLPICMALINIGFLLTCVGWGTWMLVTLKKLEQLHFNDITICLLFTMASSSFELLHQACEFIQMLILDLEFQVTFSGTPGIAQVGLTGLGCFLVMADLKIPLLWMQIATSGMNKAEAERKKKLVGKVRAGA